MSTDDLSGQTIGQYELREVLGKGGMATVYRAFHMPMRRYVALKTIPAEMTGHGGITERLGREAQVMARLDHAHIVPVYDYGFHGQRIYIVTRLLSGGTLGEQLAKGILPLEDSKRIAIQIASALDYAHQQGVLHRDVKPNNILFDDHSNAYLSDFNLAKLVLDEHQFGSGIPVGTPSYISPEQGQGLALTPASDQYSFAIVVFQMLTGQLPYIAETPLGVLFKHIQQPPPLLSSFRADLPSALDAVFNRALAKKPEERYASVSEFAQEMGKALGDIAVIPNPASSPQPPRQMRVFVSYSKQNRAQVERLVKQLEDWGHDVWHDRELIPGHNWWEGILTQIRATDLFIFALTPQALDSMPCQLEYNYAAALKKRVLPVMLDAVSTHNLPPPLAVIQWVDFRAGDVETTLQKAFANLPIAHPLPAPLPNAPAAPISPLSELRAQIDGASLTGDQQRLIVAKLEEFLNDSKDAPTARELLRRLRKHRDLIGVVEKKIETLLASGGKRGFTLFPRWRD
jgi:serine/threonine protein kinase